MPLALGPLPVRPFPFCGYLSHGYPQGIQYPKSSAFAPRPQKQERWCFATPAGTDSTCHHRLGPPHFLSQGYVVQALAVDLLFYHPAIQEVTLRTAAMLCLAPAYSPELGVRAVEVCAIM